MFSSTHPLEPSRARRSILNLLKEKGAMDPVALAKKLKVTPMAVRQHLYEMEAEKLVTYQEESRPVGRPAKMWRLTPDANRIFPDAHAELTASLLDHVQKAFGAQGLEKIISLRLREQLDAYLREMEGTKTLKQRLEILCNIRVREGYMAELVQQNDQSWLLIENHCPICAAATQCQGLCQSELSLFKNIVGEAIKVERVEHLLAGARRCAYRFSKAD